MFTIDQLQQLVTIYNEKTLSEAAEVLHISQPALSRSVQKLEHELQVSLFDRKKNRIEFNENGILAVEHATRILQQVQEMHRAVLEKDQSSKKISIGSCAPAPLWSILPILSGCFPNLRITTEVRESEEIEAGIVQNLYQIAVLQYEFSDKDYVSIPCCTEQLYLTVPPAHPLAHKEAIELKEIDGITMLLMTNLGFWGKIGREKLPHTKFLVQQEQEAFQELIEASALPAFTTNLAMQTGKKLNNRVVLPILDPEVTVTFYVVVKRQEEEKFRHFLRLIKM